MDQLQLLASSANISAIIALIASVSKRTPEDIVSDVMGPLMFLYYWYMKSYKSPPRDLDELVDGILFLDTQVYLRENQVK